MGAGTEDDYGRCAKKYETKVYLGGGVWMGSDCCEAGGVFGRD